MEFIYPPKKIVCVRKENKLKIELSKMKLQLGKNSQIHTAQLKLQFKTTE